MKQSVISCVIITHNNSDTLENSLKSVQWADEIVVVDDFSTDQTPRIAQKHGAEVYTRKFDNFGLQKQFGIDKALGEWILLLDADEVVSEKLHREIKQVIKVEAVFAYHAYFREYFLDKELPVNRIDGGCVRLFKKGQAQYGSDQIHERLVVKGNVGILKEPIDHYSYQSIAWMLKKLNHYASLEASQLKNAGTSFHWLLIVSSPAYIFWKRFVRYNYYQAGMHGFILSLLFSFAAFLKWAKVWEINK